MYFLVYNGYCFGTEIHQETNQSGVSNILHIGETCFPSHNGRGSTPNIFHIGETFAVLKQIPTLIGQIINDSMMMLDRLFGMLNSRMVNTMFISPFGSTANAMQDCAVAFVHYFMGLMGGAPEPTSAVAILLKNE